MQIDFGRTIKIVIFAEIIRESCFQQISTLHKLLKFHLISWCGKFVKIHLFQRVSNELPNTLRKLFISYFIRRVTSSYNVQNGLKGVFGVFAFHLYEIVFAVCGFWNFIIWCCDKLRETIFYIAMNNSVISSAGRTVFVCGWSKN